MKGVAEAGPKRTMKQRTRRSLLVMRSAGSTFACAVVVRALLAVGTIVTELLAPGALGAEPAATKATTVDFSVSPKGNDDWSGRPADPGENDGPFATLGRALHAVRIIRKTQPETAVRVTLRGGTYRLQQTLEFGPADSGTKQVPVVCAAAGGGDGHPQRRG